MNTIEFIHELNWDTLPVDVRTQVRRCFMDTVGTAIGGRQTELSRIVHNFAALAYGGTEAQLWFDGRQVSAPGAALANGMTIDALDIHDSCRPVKGHAGVALVPAVLATLNLDRNGPVSGQELLTSLVVGYEIAIRAGKSLHASACDYHTSGAWNTLGCAAITARRLGSSSEQTRHALGIAEYHGPRSQMMRCIDHPTMVKDGSGWGAMAGVSAGLLAASGFTGAPALTVESAKVADIWTDLGQQWDIMIQYFKPYPVCYWAQPAIAGALNLQKTHNLRPDGIRKVKVFTFHEATRLACRRPQSTEEAQYSLPFPLAAALFHQCLTYEQLSGAALRDPAVLALTDRIELIEDDAFNVRFPADRLSRVMIETSDGTRFDSGEARALWDVAATPPSDEALQEKFRQLAQSCLSEARAQALEAMLWGCDRLDDAFDLMGLIAPAA